MMITLMIMLMTLMIMMMTMTKIIIATMMLRMIMMIIVIMTVICHLEDVVEHGCCVLVVRLCLARGQRHQPSPGVTQVTAVAPGQLVLVILHLLTLDNLTLRCFASL